MESITRITDLPFFEKPPRELLGIEYGSFATILDYYGYGYGHLDLVCLLQTNNLAQPIIRNALVLALHSADDGESMTDDIELEFFVDEIAEDYSVTVLLSRFLDVWLPLMARDEATIVLALCNPHQARIVRPGFAGGVPVYYALGDVVALVEYYEGREFFYLHAAQWLLTE